MKQPDFTTHIEVSKSARQAFDAIKDVRGWWSEEIEGRTDQLNAIFKYHFEDVHRCEIKIIDFVQDKKIEWLVLDNFFKFTKDKTEWNGTKIIFEITETEGKTQIQFTHQGLTDEYECFDICRKAWTTYINTSLYNLIMTGKGNPNGKDKPQTENEKELLKK